MRHEDNLTKVTRIVYDLWRFIVFHYRFGGILHMQEYVDALSLTE